MVHFNCTSCKKWLVVPDKYVGKKCRCPQCKNTMVVPGVSKRDKASYVVAQDLGSKAFPNASPGRQAYEYTAPWMGRAMRNYLIFACIMAVGITTTYLFIRSLSGLGETKEIDVREVIENPDAYLNQVLTSRVKIMDWNRFAGEDGGYICLDMSEELKCQSGQICDIHGRGQYVRIMYRLYDSETLSAAKRCQEIEKQIRDRSERKRALEKEQNRLGTPVRELEVIKKQIVEGETRLKGLTEEQQQLAKSLSEIRTMEEKELQRISEIEVRLQQLGEEKAELDKERARIRASEGEDTLQRLSQIDARLEQIGEEIEALAKEKDELQPEVKVKEDLERLAKEEVRLRQLLTNREAQEQINRDKAKLAEEEAKSLGRAASQVTVVTPRTQYPTTSRRTSVISGSSVRGSGGSVSSASSSGPTRAELRQEQRAREERERYAAQKKERNKLLAQEQKQSRAAVVARARAERLAKEQIDIRRLIEETVESQEAIGQEEELRKKAQEEGLSQQLGNSEENLRQLYEERAELERLRKEAQRLGAMAKANSPRLTAIAQEIEKLVKAERAVQEIQSPVDAHGFPMANLDSSGVLLDIDVPRYQ